MNVKERIWARVCNVCKYGKNGICVRSYFRPHILSLFLNESLFTSFLPVFRQLPYLSSLFISSYMLVLVSLSRFLSREL